MPSRFHFAFLSLFVLATNAALVASARTVHAEAPERPSVELSGYLQTQATAPLDTNDDGAAENDTFHLRRVRVRMKGSVISKVGFTLMLDPSTPSNLLRDGFVSLSHIPYHEIRIGQQKTQFGYENPESSTKLYTVNRAFVSDALGRGPDLRDLGVGVLARIPVGGGFDLEYAVTVVNGAGPNVSKDDNDAKDVWGRAGATYRRGSYLARAGVSGAAGERRDRGADPMDPADDVSVNFLRLGADGEVETPWAILLVEYLWGKNEGGATETTAHGFYATAIGKTPWSMGPILRYDRYDPDTDADDDQTGRLTVGAYYDVSGIRTRLIANYELDLSDQARDDALLLWAQILF